MLGRGLRRDLVAVTAVVVAGLLVFACDGNGAAAGPVDGAAAMDHVKVIVGYGPRPSGSPAIEQTQAYLAGEIEKLGLPVHNQRWEDPSQPKVRFFRNIWTEIEGQNPAAPKLILAAHYDSKSCKDHANEQHNLRFVGAIDGAGATAVLLELARILKDRENYMPIWILWLDGEESIPFDWDDNQALYGSKHFVQEMGANKKLYPKGLARGIGAFVLLDLTGSKNQKIDRDFASFPGLSDIFKKAAVEMGEGDRLFEFKSEFVDDHIPFKNRGVKVIDLIDFTKRTPREAKDPRYERWWHTAKDDLPAMDPRSLGFVGNLVIRALPHLEKDIFGKK